MSGFIRLEQLRGGHVVLNTDDIVCVYDSESYSNGREVVIKMRNKQEWAFARLTAVDVERLISKAAGSGPGKEG